MKPGIYHNLPIQQYHAADGYSSSHVRKIINGSPLEYYYEYVQQEKPDLTKWSNTNRAMCVGGAVAALMDGPDVVNHNYLILNADISELNKNTKLFKDAFANATIRDPERTVILWQESLQASTIVESVHNHPDPETAAQLEELFDDPDLESEVSYFHEDKETGLLIKSRPDLSLPGLLCDIKTTTGSCAPYEYSKRILNSGLNIQAAMGLDIVNAVRGSDITNWLLIVVEQSPPHDVAIYYLDESTLALGRREYRRGLQVLAECLETDTWPGKVSGIQRIGVPDWVFKQELNRFSEELM